MKGFNVLIVDDEIHAVRGIVAGIDWEGLGISSLYTAHNKKQAQSVFMNHHIDLLLSDIDMPKGSGIELLSWVRGNYPETEAIFISCHSDFTFAKEALNLKTLNYFLKPIDYHELELEIKEGLSKIQSNRDMNQVEESYLNLQKVYKSNQEKTFWKKLVDGVIPSSEDNLKEYLGRYDISFDGQTLFLPVLAHIRCSNNGKYSNKTRDERPFIRFIRKEVTKSQLAKTIIQLSPNHLLFIIQKPKVMKDEEQMMSQFEHIVSQTQGFPNHSVCLYVGRQSPLHKLVSVIDELKELDKNNIVYKNKIIRLDDYNEGYFIPELPKSIWMERMKTGPKEKILADIQKYIASWETQNVHVTWKSFHLFYQDFLQIIFYLLQTKGLEANKVFSNNLLLNGLENIDSVEEFKEHIQFILKLSMEQIHPQPDNSNSVIEQVKKFIEEYSGDHKLTRDDIANHVYLNPDYLTRIFKKKTGCSISAYLQRVRMEKAKHLLIHTELPISTVSLECGYANFSYFSTLFKNSTNLNPKEFRKKVTGRDA
ncbi:hypothetical protein ACA30_00795 [Virgibacillus soli]|uniref:response regulator transcription factor n=1 Tax=Lederbergia galactosidilytica TaxID=217031 RepID=UPI0007159F01|nr:helix-turn-helix domain-containing protein [Lederbergia galactosidilytica]KRG16290.1 hypothetical protein ACA30_00795 [Virgibacillus soli]MBP1915148.1 two-component system response regulator YesN [Lederbergia galactosidilytica]